VAAGALVMSVTAAAQPLSEEKLGIEREVVVTGEPGELPAVVYGAANIGVQIVFDAPLQRTDAGIALRLLGGDVRLHPYLENALVLTPSRALASGPMVPLHVALVDGGVPLLLTFQPGKVDHVLYILQRPRLRDAGTAMSRTAFQETLSATASAIFKDDDCAPLQSPRVRAKKVWRARSTYKETPALICAVGMINYLRVRRTAPRCAVSSARLLRQGRDVEVLLLEQAQLEKGVIWQVLATWTPPEREDVELLLLAADGTRCEQHDVALGPGDSP
jgi:hypothetical protein